MQRSNSTKVRSNIYRVSHGIVLKPINCHLRMHVVIDMAKAALKKGKSAILNGYKLN